MLVSVADIYSASHGHLVLVILSGLVCYVAWTVFPQHLSVSKS
jgi:hypothetical protein